MEDGLASWYHLTHISSVIKFQSKESCLSYECAIAGANQTSYEDVGGSDIVPMVEELMTSFSKRYFCMCS